MIRVSNFDKHLKSSARPISSQNIPYYKRKPQLKKEKTPCPVCGVPFERGLRFCCSRDCSVEFATRSASEKKPNLNQVTEKKGCGGREAETRVENFVKLKHLRSRLNLSQVEMAHLLNIRGLQACTISQSERTGVIKEKFIDPLKDLAAARGIDWEDL